MDGCSETESMRRRDFLAAVLAAPVLAAARIDRSRLSAITDEIARTPADAIAFLRQYGLQWAELRGVPGGKASYAFLGEPELKAAAREFAEAGIGISFLNTPMLKFTLPGTEPVRRQPETAEERTSRIGRDTRLFERRMEDLRKAIRAAHVLGVDKVRIFAFSRVENPMVLMPRIADILSEMVETAAKEKVRLLVENETSCNIATCAELAELMARAPSKWLGINWDVLNGLSLKETPFPDGYRLLPKERIGNVQIKGRSVLKGPQQLDWAAIFRALEGDGYQGQVGLETHIFDRLIEASHESIQEIIRIVEGKPL